MQTETLKKENDLPFGETKIKMPFSVGDVVYFLQSGEVQRDIIKKIEIVLEEDIRDGQRYVGVSGRVKFMFRNMNETSEVVSLTNVFASEMDLLRSISVNYQTDRCSLLTKVQAYSSSPNLNLPFYKIVGETEETID